MANKTRRPDAALRDMVPDGPVFRIEKDTGKILTYLGESKTSIGQSFKKLEGHSLYGLARLDQPIGDGEPKTTESKSKETLIPKEIRLGQTEYQIKVIGVSELDYTVILLKAVDQQRILNQIETNEKAFGDFFASINDVYYQTNAERVVEIMSPSIERLVGMKPEQFIGKRTDSLIKKEKADEIFTALKKSGRLEDVRLNFRLPNGECKVLSFNIEAKSNETGDIVGTVGIIRDITKQALSERELVNSENKFKEIFHSISDIYYRSDKDSVVKIISPSVEQITGFKPEEVLGKRERDFYKDPVQNDLLVEHLKEKGSIRNVHGEILGKDKSTIYVSLTASAHFDKKGNFIGSNGIIRDISREKRHSQTTHLTKEILEKVAKGSDLLDIMDFACHGVEQIMPGMYCSVLLYEKEKGWLVDGAGPSLPKSYRKLIREYPIGPSNGSCGTAAYTKQTVVVSDIANDPLWAAHPEWALAHNLRACWSVPILSMEDQVLGTFAVYYKEVNEPNKAELELIQGMGNILSLAIEHYLRKKELTSSEKRYRQLVDNSPVAILIHTNGIIKFVNKEVLRIGKASSEDQLLGKSVMDFVKPSFQDQVQKRIKKLEESKVMPRAEEQFITLDGRLIDVEVMGTSILYHGQLSTQLVFYDISERKALEKEQNKLNGFLIKQNKQLEEFAHIASHNLRAPIANIHSLLGLYELDNSEENVEFVLKQLKNTSSNLYDTIKELTEVIKTSWELNKQQQKLSFSETLKKVKQDVSSEIIKKNAVIVQNFDQIDIIEYPKVYLESIVQNLLSNALKYCHPDRRPEIVVSTTVENGQVFLSVKDNGLGINLKKHKDKLFGLRKTFHHNENARGVGLFITKAQVESMGGEIDIKSKVDVGSEFIVNFGSSKYMKDI